MSEQNNSAGTPIEFNSMSAILQRLDKLFYAINESRRNEDYKMTLEYLSEFFKEICPDIEETKADKIQIEIQQLRGITPYNNKRYWLIRLDDLDIKLRRLAKKAGYLTRNSKDVRTSVTEM